MSSHLPVPVSADGAELYIPRSEYERRVFEQAQDLAREQSFVGFGQASSSTFFGVGSQPSDERLLQGTKGWAAIAATAVARRVRGLELEVGVQVEAENGGTEFEIIDGHILAGIFAKPNPIFSGKDMLWLAALHLQQVGEAYWQKVVDPLGVVRELWPLPPQNVEMVITRDGMPAFNVRGSEGRQQTLEPGEVVHFWEPDPETLTTAMGRLGPQWTEFLTSRYIAQHQEKHYQHDAVPRVVLEAGEGAEVPSQAQKNSFLNRFRNDYNARVGRRTSELAFLPKNWSAKELRGDGGIDTTVPLDESKRQQLLAAYGVPGSIVGMVEDVNRAAAETNQFVFDQHTVEPMTSLMQEALTLQLAIDYDPLLRVRFKPFVSADKDFELRSEDQDLRTGARTVNEVREARGRQPADWGELPIMPFSMAPYTGESDFGDDANDLRGSRAAHGPPGLSGLPDAARASSHTRVDQTSLTSLSRELARYERKYVPRMMRSIQKIFAQQLSIILESLESMPDTGSTIAQGGRTRALTSEMSQAVNLALGDRPFERGEDVYEIVDDAWRESASVAFEGVTDEGVQTWSGFAKMAADNAGRQTIKMASDVNQATRRKVTRILEQGIAEGDSVDGLAKRIRDSGTFSRKRARTIARTEIGGAHQAAQHQGWRATGQVEGRQWDTASDELVRDSHVFAHGQRVSLDEPFILGSGNTTMVPRSPVLPPEDRVNCRCQQLAVIIGGEI